MAQEFCHFCGCRLIRVKLNLNNNHGYLSADGSVIEIYEEERLISSYGESYGALKQMSM